MEAKLLTALVVVLVGLVGAYSGYQAVTALLSFWQGLRMSDENLAQKYPMVLWIGAIVGAVVAILGSVFLLKSGAGID